MSCGTLCGMQYMASYASMICSSTKVMSVQHDTASLPSMSLTLGGKAIVRNRRSQKPINRNPAEKEVANKCMFITVLFLNKSCLSHSTMRGHFSSWKCFQTKLHASFAVQHVNVFEWWAVKIAIGQTMHAIHICLEVK